MQENPKIHSHIPGLTKKEFFAGRSMPRNRELMRIFKDLNLVEQLGSGVHRILEVYNEDVFKFSENFLEICFLFENDFYGNDIKSINEENQILNIETIISSFGNLSEIVMNDKIDNIELLESSFFSVTNYLQQEYNFSSGKLQESFRKVSGKEIPTKLMILMLILIYPNINADNISRIIGVSERTVFTYFNKLKEENLIKRDGGRKEGKWEIVKQD